MIRRDGLSSQNGSGAAYDALAFGEEKLEGVGKQLEGAMKEVYGGYLRDDYEKTRRRFTFFVCRYTNCPDNKKKECCRDEGKNFRLLAHHPLAWYGVDRGCHADKGGGYDATTGCRAVIGCHTGYSKDRGCHADEEKV